VLLVHLNYCLIVAYYCIIFVRLSPNGFSFMLTHVIVAVNHVTLSLVWPLLPTLPGAKKEVSHEDSTDRRPTFRKNVLSGCG